MGPKGRGDTGGHPGDVGVYGIVDVLGCDMMFSGEPINPTQTRYRCPCESNRQLVPRRVAQDAVLLTDKHSTTLKEGQVAYYDSSVPWTATSLHLRQEGPCLGGSVGWWLP